MYYIFYGFIWLITWLPLPVLYILSDIIFPVVYYIAGYRKNVVRLNLSNSFPDKSSKELKSIEFKFYRFFCDLFVESLYEMHISKKEMLKRMSFSNPEVVLAEYEKGKSCMLMTSHYGNWEWASAFSLLLPPDKPMYSVYKKLKAKKFDALMYELREKSTSKNVEKDDLVKTLFRLKKDGKLAMFGMISDQSPARNAIDYWTNFLNQDTAVITGTEVLARKFDYPVFFGKITRLKRGYYNCEFIPVSLEPSKTEQNEITERYTRLLENTIEENPAYWLWTHKRWKYKRQQ